MHDATGVSVVCDIERVLPVLRLTMIEGLGPVLIRRAVEAFGSAEEALRRSEREWRAVKGIGAERAKRVREGLAESERLAQHEAALAQRLGVRIVVRGDAAYPPLLAQLPDAPALLYVRGGAGAEKDRHCAAIVGSRACTHYGVEQAERFAAMLAECGLTVVSGGARGIDTAAHRATVRAKGRTVVVSGCGLAHCYPPENAALFDEVVASGGAIVSELPLSTAPSAENFPARNRIISGMALGVVVIEASRKSGALITAKHAAEEQGREVMAVPGRIDSPSSEGSNMLIRDGGAALVTSPQEVVRILEAPARYLFEGVHEHRYGAPDAEPGSGSEADAADGASGAVGAGRAAASLELKGLSESQLALVNALDEARTIDDLVRITGASVPSLMADATALEIRRVVVRRGNRLARRVSEQ